MPSLPNIIAKSKSSAVKLIEQMIVREEDEEVDRSKDYIRFQKKFNKQVIVDEYTQEGLEKNKKNMDEEFAELFGKFSDDTRPKIASPF